MAFAGATLVVCPSGTSGQNNCDHIGGEGIQTAVDVAPPGADDDRTKILIKSGTYTIPSSLPADSSCFIDTKEKYLILEGEQGSKLDGGGSTTINGICSGAAAIEIKKLTVTGFRNGIKLFNNAHAIIKSSLISLNQEHGITLRENSQAAITGSTISSNLSHGILLSNSTFATIQNNIVSNNQKSGIHFLDGDPSATSFIVNNTIVGNNISGNHDQIALYKKTNVNMKNNIITNGTNRGIYKAGNDQGDYRHTGSLALTYNILWNNKGGNYEGVTTDSHSTDSSEELQFLSPTDFHLQSRAPGDPIILDLDGTTVSDRGAYGGPGACILDPNLPGCSICNGSNHIDEPSVDAQLVVGNTYTIRGWNYFCSGPNGSDQGRTDLHICDREGGANCINLGGQTTRYNRSDIMNSCSPGNPSNSNSVGWTYDWIVPTQAIGTNGQRQLQSAAIKDPLTSSSPVDLRCIKWANKNVIIVTPTPVIDPTPPINPACVCDTGDVCNPGCTFSLLPAPSSYTSPIKCSLSATLFDSVPSADNKISWCRATNRTKGDANGDGKIENIDYYYYVAAVNGGKIPVSANPDFNGDGEVGTIDRAMLIKSLYP